MKVQKGPGCLGLICKTTIFNENIWIHWSRCESKLQMNSMRRHASFFGRSPIAQDSSCTSRRHIYNFLSVILLGNLWATLLRLYRCHSCTQSISITRTHGCTHTSRSPKRWTCSEGGSCILSPMAVVTDQAWFDLKLPHMVLTQQDKWDFVYSSATRSHIALSHRRAAKKVWKMQGYSTSTARDCAVSSQSLPRDPPDPVTAGMVALFFCKTMMTGRR